MNVIESKITITKEDIERHRKIVEENKEKIRNSLNAELKKEKIKSTTTIREIFERAFKNNNLDYINPHSFRHTLSKAMKRDTNCTRLIPCLARKLWSFKRLSSCYFNLWQRLFDRTS